MCMCINYTDQSAYLKPTSPLIRYHEKCLKRIESSSDYFHNARHGFGFTCLYTAWLLTAVAFTIKARGDLRNIDN